MRSFKKAPEKLRGMLKAGTLRQGSYRLVTDPSQTVVIKPATPISKKQAELNETDWFYQMLDAVWEQAEQAYYQGLEEGYTAGLEKGREDAKQIALNFRRTLETMETNLLEYYTGVEHWSVKLSLSVAEKVVGRAAEQHLDLIQQTVRQAIQETADKTRLLVRVHPADFETLKDIRTEITALSEGIEHFKIEADGAVTPGSCRIETPAGLLDADFNTQLHELRRALIQHEETTP
jgi:flagellar biosynthesis/type III secretory pathway protein FliH